MAVRFDASDEGLYRTTNLPSMDLFTVAGWAHMVTDRNAVTGICALLNGSGQGVQLITTSNGNTLRIYSSGNENTGSDLAQGEWVHLALTKNGSAIRLYVNGALDISRTDSINVTPAYLVFSTGASTWFNGRFGQWRVWDAQLSQSEVQAEMRSTTPVRTSNLNSAFAFTSSTTADSSGNGRNLTAQGTLSLEDYTPPVYAIGLPAQMMAGAAAGSVSAEAGSADENVTSLPSIARLGAAGAAASATGNASLVGLPAFVRLGAALAGFTASANLTGSLAGANVRAAVSAVAGAAVALGVPASMRMGSAAAVVSAGTVLVSLSAAAKTGGAAAEITAAAALACLVASVRVGAVGAVVSTGVSAVVFALPASARAGAWVAALLANANVSAQAASIFARAVGAAVSTGIGVSVIALPAAAFMGARAALTTAGASLLALPAWTRGAAASAFASGGVSVGVVAAAASLRLGGAGGSLSAGVNLPGAPSGLRLGAPGASMGADVFLIAFAAVALGGAAPGWVGFAPSSVPSHVVVDAILLWQTIINAQPVYHCEVDAAQKWDVDHDVIDV